MAGDQNARVPLFRRPDVLRAPADDPLPDPAQLIGDHPLMAAPAPPPALLDMGVLKVGYWSEGGRGWIHVRPAPKTSVRLWRLELASEDQKASGGTGKASTLLNVDFSAHSLLDGGLPPEGINLDVGDAALPLRLACRWTASSHRLPDGSAARSELWLRAAVDPLPGVRYGPHAQLLN